MPAFDQKYRTETWPFEFDATLHVRTLCGGVPSVPSVAEAWIRSKVVHPDRVIREMLRETLTARDVGEESNGTSVVTQVAEKNINGFKRDENGLYIEGRQAKAAIKEGASVAVAASKIKFRGWGPTNKSLQSFLPEHVCVLEDKIHLGVHEASGVNERFIPKNIPGKGRVSSIHNEEYVEDVDLSFTVMTDFDFSERDWAIIWITGEQQGIGASRSQGFGRYEVARWERVR